MRYIFVLIFSFFHLANSHAQSDVDNGKDYPSLDRLPNFYLSKYTELEFDSHSFYYDQTNHIHEGRKYEIEYRHNESKNANFEFPTRLQILRNYSNAIEKAGGRILFERYNSEHGFYSFENSDHKVVWIQVKVASGKSYKLIIIEEENMRQDLVIDADFIKNAIEIEGRIAIYGIYFDTGSATIKSESEPALSAIATFLKENPMVNCWVVGHTDSDGSFQVNSQLSLERAKSVKQILQKQYGISEDRLFAEGVGPLAPVASNNTQEGKSKNRRVELVKK